MKKMLAFLVFAILWAFPSTGCLLVVNMPPDKQETAPPEPAPEHGHYHVWVKGHWVKRHGDWVWIPGHWKKVRR